MLEGQLVAVSDLLGLLGFIINKVNLQTAPTHEFLGLLVNSTSISLKLPCTK